MCRFAIQAEFEPLRLRRRLALMTSSAGGQARANRQEAPAAVQHSFTEPEPSTEPDSALPSVLARLLAFVSIFIGAGAGGMIGHTFADLAGFGGAAIGLITFLSILLGAGGVAIVSVLTLRAFGEWETIRSDRG